MFIVAIIHNNSLGRVIEVESIDKGKQIVSDLVFYYFKRPMTDEERDDLEDRNEVYNDSDSDNIWAFSIGQVEEL